MLKTHARMIGSVVAMALALAGCSGEDEAVANAATQSPTPQVATPSTSEAAEGFAPVLTGEPEVQALAGTPWQFQPTATDPDSSGLSFAAAGLPAWLSLDAGTGRLSGTPAQEDAGTTADITLSVSDGLYTASLPVFRISVAAIETAPPAPPAADNQAPTIAGSPATTVVATQAYAFTPTAADVDSASLTFAVANKPSWAHFSTTTGRLSGTPAADQVGTHAGIVISVSDGQKVAPLPAFTIEVQPAPNQAPTIGGVPVTSVAAGSAYSFTPSSHDPEGRPLGFTITNKPSWASFSTSTGKLSGSPGDAAVGSYGNIRIAVSDGAATAELPPFTITVTAKNGGAPLISGSPAKGVVAGSAYAFTPTASDPDGDPLTFSITGKPSWATFNTATGRLAGTPTGTQIGSYGNIVISVSDGSSSRSLAAFSITVSSPGTGTGAATLSWMAPQENDDGTTLTNLAGYRIYHGSSATSLTAVVSITNAGITTYVFDALASGTHYFAISALNSSGLESGMSAVVSKRVP